MQAMNGSAVPVRSRGRLIGCCMALALALTALVFAPAAANAFEPVAPTTTTYLALGDSISFGYTAEKNKLYLPNESPSFYEEGVANDFTKFLSKGSEIGKSVRLVNNACPGETSNGLIGENPELGGMKSTEPAGSNPQGLGDWHPCAYSNVDGLPLHNSLAVNKEGGKETISQLESAVSILTTPNVFTGEPQKVGAITLNIGSNDELAAIGQCTKEVTEEFETKGESKYGKNGEAAVTGCLVETAQTVTFPHIIENLFKTLGALEHFYSGPIVLVGYYNPQAFTAPGTDALQEGLNAAVESVVIPTHPHTTYANPFPVFNKGAGKNSAKEQESICKYTEMCNPNVQTVPGFPEGKDGDIHPTIKGYKEMAKLINKAYLANPAR
jgi:lysophospholipase L1-like esterase